MTTIAADPEEAKALLQRCGAMQQGHFLLSSGLHSDKYVQVTRISDYPADLEQVARTMAPSLALLQPDIIVSPALGAILFGHELARALGVRHAFAERPTGRFELRRGFRVEPGERVLLAENVVTTGGSVLEVAELIRSLGGVVAGFATVIDRSQGRFAPAEPVVAFAQVEALAYPPEDCPLCRAGVSMTRPGSRVTLPSQS